MRVATIARIPIRIHWSLLVFAGIFAASSLVRGGGGAMASTATLVVALFGTVLLHELGHAMAARGFGIRTRDITLYPFGGIATIAGEPRRPWQELVVAVAGPAVNFGLAALFGLGWLVAGGGGFGLLAEMAVLNLGMGMFNLVPAFPMDGGRVLRALLSGVLGHERGTAIALALGTAFGWLFLAGGLVSGQWSLALVGGFLLLALPGERRRLEWRIQQEARASRPRIVYFDPPRIRSRTVPVRWRVNPPRS
jgi:Zn-dependent protease